MELWAFAHGISDLDANNSKVHGYRYSVSYYSSEKGISYPQPKFLVFLPLLLLMEK